MVEMITYDPEIFNETWNKISNVTEKRMKKYRVETDLLGQYDVGEEIDRYLYQMLTDTKGCPESWFSPVEEEVKEGWYHIKRGFQNALVHTDGYGFGFDKEWTDNFAISILGKQDHIGVGVEKREANPNEIEEHLIAEAKRRGFEDGMTVKREWDNQYDKITLRGNVDGATYFSRDDTLLMSSYGTIYREGKWAEPIVDEPIQINGYEAEFKDGYVQFGCAKINNGLLIDLYRTIDSHRKNNNSIGADSREVKSVTIGNGEFTIEDIKKIAKRIES